MLQNIIAKYFRNNSGYRSQITRLASGNILAAVIPFLFQPIISRLYNATDFSVLGWYLSFIGIISVFATGKYELAIIIPESDKESKNLAVLSLILTCLVSIFVFIFSILFYKSIASYVNTGEVIWIFLIGPGVLFYCSYQVFYYVANRYSLYNSMSISKINQNAGIVIIQLVFGIISIGGIGLVVGRLFGYFTSAIVLGWFTFKYSSFNRNEIKMHSLNTLSKSYSNFPKHLVFSNLLAAVYTQMPFIYIAKQFNSEVAGQFAFSMQMITVPGILISNAIGDVFRQKASELYKISGRFDNLLIKTLKKCFLVSIIPFTILVIFSVPIFKFFFGENWILAGKFASVLSIMAFIGFFITPVDKAAIVVNRTNFEFWYQISRFAANCIIIIIAVQMALSVFTYLYLLVVINAIHYFVDLLFSYKFSLPSTVDE
jgi:O-antigen/teichoic acid export membrane protein